jgi:hypothetical protein
MMALKSRIDEKDIEVWVEDPDGESRDPGATAEIGEALSCLQLRECRGESGGVQYQTRGDLKRTAVTSEVDAARPFVEEHHEVRQLLKGAGIFCEAEIFDPSPQKRKDGLLVFDSRMAVFHCALRSTGNISR